MAKSKVEKMSDIDKQIEDLQNQKKELQKQHNNDERKARTNRLCKRGGIVEKLLPDLIEFTDEQFDIFLEKTLLTPYTRRVIAEIKAQGGEIVAINPQESNEQLNSASAEKAVEPPQNTDETSPDVSGENAEDKG